MDDMLIQQLIDALAVEIDVDADTIEYTEDTGYGDGIVVSDDHQEYYVFESEEDGEEAALDYVRDQLKEEPEMFTQSWLQGFITISPTDINIISNEESDNWVTDMSDTETLDQADLTDDYEAIDDAITDIQSTRWSSFVPDIDDEADFSDEDKETIESLESDHSAVLEDFGRTVTDLQLAEDDLLEKAREIVKDEKHDEIVEQLKNNLSEYLDELGMDMSASFVHIDIDEAADDAVNTDGAAHFLSSYDGKILYLENDGVAFRTN